MRRPAHVLPSSRVAPGAHALATHVDCETSAGSTASCAVAIHAVEHVSTTHRVRQ